MKRVLLLLILGGLFLTETVAQQIEIGGFYGYTLNTRARTYYGDYTLYNNPNYGGHLSVELMSDMFVELTYNRSDTQIKYYWNNAYEPLDMSSEYFQVGGLQQINTGSDALKPFGSFSIGATRFNLQESYGEVNAADKWYMSIALAGGAKILLGEKLGIRLQARMGLPMSFSGLWLGTGGSGASFYVPVAQFDFTAGVFLRFGS
ncbi:MAG: hypothetical protein DRJ29_11215 [Bacteroidetes bacterium]|nr:MAG: hypothetical protein DRI98_12600 [Bacteroidota bacterium]RLD92618.1 MAG: hypothetical protein DRJ29_11215 [Bacteroidota bacterium]RLE02243.1 MAG: hypothetical protein DRJ13_05820 [Bacteroidota bacterium]